MTTDITELAQGLKAAAEKATPGQWVAFTHADSRTFSVHTPDDKRCGDVIKWAGFDGQRKANAEFIALANPANVLALVEALKNTQTENELARGQLFIAQRTLLNQQRKIAELESRTVKLPPCVDDVHGIGMVMSSDAVVEALTAAGIKVEAE